LIKFKRLWLVNFTLVNPTQTFFIIGGLSTSQFFGGWRKLLGKIFFEEVSAVVG
jgi:hypothetical protein